MQNKEHKINTIHLNEATNLRSEYPYAITVIHKNLSKPTKTSLQIKTLRIFERKFIQFSTVFSDDNIAHNFD